MRFRVHAAVLLAVVAGPVAAAPAPQSCKWTRDALERIVEAESRAHGLNPDVVAAIVHVESRWNPCARSHKGAIGLMQLMPETVRRIAGLEPHDALDAENNVHWALRYIEEIMEVHGDDLDTVLSVYYSGQPNADRPDVRRYVDDVRHAAYERVRKRRQD
jgi:soluble lytic murein transglycosylase-like protein